MGLIQGTVAGLSIVPRKTDTMAHTTASASQRGSRVGPVGLRLKLGYGFMGDPELRLDPTESGGHPIPVHGATLGSLELDAAFFRTSFELRL